MFRSALRMTFLVLAVGNLPCQAADEMPDQWTKSIPTTAPTRPNTTWFQQAKFGIFMHWGLYSEAGNVWKGKTYYGSGEWLMNVAKIPANDYASLATTFNPSHFSADKWASFIQKSGAKYLVITAKHHEGFAMFKSAASPFNIVDATPYQQDPMKPLADACRAKGIEFGFYYSQYLDWHEANGGGNTWDFDKGSKDVKKYYAEKSMPQIKELLSNYGPLGIMWFDMPGGLTRDETIHFMNGVRAIQPNCLISSRVGQGLGDFSDLGDSELPATPIDGAWEALFTHTDSWGFQAYDQAFKSPREVIQLLAMVSARGGNLILNVGPDGNGDLPEKSVEYLEKVGDWLTKNGDAIYATSHSPFPDQPWGVATTKPTSADAGHLFLHVFNAPLDHQIFVPTFAAHADRVTLLNQPTPIVARPTDGGLMVSLPDQLPDASDTVIDVTFTDGAALLKTKWADVPATISTNYNDIVLDSSQATLAGKAVLQRKTYSRYFGNWKHDTIINEQRSPADTAIFNTKVLEPGDYRVILDYACPPEGNKREGVIDLAGNAYTFQTVITGTFDSHAPLMLYHHVIGVVTIPKAGDYALAIHPKEQLVDGTPPLFWLRRVTLEPVK